jgi:hypothetical protein
MLRRVPRRILVRIAPIWIVGLAAVSLQGWRPRTACASAVHQAFHFLAFGASTLLLLLLARTAGQRLYAALGIVALAIAIEYAQYSIFGSALEWWDMRDDAAAAFAAWLIGQWPALRRALVAET